MVYPKTIGVLSDLHCGSREGLLSPRNERFKLNAGQRYLYKRWMWLAENWPKLDLLILNGDVIDGEQYKSGHTGIHTAKMAEQVDLAVEVVEDWVKANRPRKIVRIDGTPYHEGFHGAVEKFDEKLGAAWAGDVLDLKLAKGALLNIKHQPEGGAALYKGTTLEREVLWTITDETLHGAPKATHIVRSHLHFGYRQDSFGKVIVLTPGWQLQTAHARKSHYRRWQPMIGGVLLEQDDLAENGYAVHATKFPLPKRKARKYASLRAQAKAGAGSE